ncbi:glycosyltransferase [Ornithinimicrobium kibberense]|uniref:Glycosyltransferase n=1 Tax=Ornithinimicrobium kibberense TaxID=282060 RepID=A0ABV5V2H1_9MICO|nr:glycosyltransferase [Ornithinimicrobium kibberense]
MSAGPSPASDGTDDHSEVPVEVPPVVHVVPGPDAHGVVLHGLRIRAATRARTDLVRADLLAEVDPARLRDRRVVVQVTDRVLAARREDALAAWRRVTAGAVRVTVVLHDLPQASDGRHRGPRSELYAALCADADDVVVASRHEELLLAAVLRHAFPGPRARALLDRTHVIPLPVVRGASPARPAPSSPPTVATLGFLYPGKGVEEVVDAAAEAGLDAVNIGGVSAGHDDLVDQLAGRAAAAGTRWSATGWVDDADLPAALAGAGIPVAAHRHLSASGSINSWLAAGRRPVVVASRYTRELAERMPGAVRLVGPTHAELVAALREAAHDPASTWLGDDVVLGPDEDEAAALLHAVVDRPAVSVVVPYYRGQAMLDVILAQLDAQEGVAGGLEVVVADDGSPEPPTVRGTRADAETGGGGTVVTAGRWPVRVVRQGRDGFRAGAARNLGARHAAGRVVVFVDGDTVPATGTVAALQKACRTTGSTLAVGHRRHATLTRADGSVTWPPQDELPEPEWLAQGFAATADLAEADDGGFRWIISAVMAVDRALWDVLGGFDERLKGYGGEDWELAWRAWLAGADLAHVPEAVAWHDGPDLKGREGEEAEHLARTKNAETGRLAPLLPHPLVRGRGWTHPCPDVVALVEATGWTPGQVEVVVETLLDHGDVGVWVRGGKHVPADPRVHVGLPGHDVLARARAQVVVREPVEVLRLPWGRWPEELTSVVAGMAGGATAPEDPPGPVSVAATRLAARGSRPVALGADWSRPVPRDVVVEHWRQRRLNDERRRRQDGRTDG